MPEPPGRKRLALWIGLLALAPIAILAVFVGLATRVNAPPRSLAPYIEHRLSDHGPLLVAAGRWLADVLMELDRGREGTRERPTTRVGARAEATSASMPPSARVVAVAVPAQVREAIAHAHAGDIITLEPGTYDFGADPVEAKEPGRSDATIVVRASRPGTVIIELRGTEGFVVSAPYWTFENLTIRGACDPAGECEHAFHVVGGAAHFVARNNALVDFNAHFKVNGHNRQFPDHGLIENNTIRNTGPRLTESPVTPIDIVAASHWTISGNLMSDFVKALGNRISYGAFAKGGGVGNRFERNVVICEDTLRGAPGWRVGLSFGGGGSGAGDFCRDRECVIEHGDGTIASNLVAFCSDDGIYLNRSATTRIVHNTLIDTGGIVVRFAESSADVEGNLVDGSIRSRDGGLIHEGDNLQTGLSGLYIGRHSQRALFRDPSALDLRWSGPTPRAQASDSDTKDLCGSERPARAAYGAFEDFAACLDGLNAAAPRR